MSEEFIVCKLPHRNRLLFPSYGLRHYYPSCGRIGRQIRTQTDCPNQRIHVLGLLAISSLTVLLTWQIRFQIS